MATQVRHRYLPCLLVTAALLALAAAILPWDSLIDSNVRTFSHRVGARYFTQELLTFIRPLGKGEVLLLLACILGVCGARKRATHILLAVLLTGILVWPLKLGVGRERPNRSNTESFPSGDTASVVAFCTPLAAASPWGSVMTVAAGSAVAAGRVYDGKHFPSDVLTGAAMGVLSAAIAWAILRRRTPRIKRFWFFLVVCGILLYDLVKLPFSRALPFSFAFLSVWGPLVTLLVFARLWPSWSRLMRIRSRPLIRGPLLAWLAILLLCVYFALTTASTLWDRDEPRFSRATVEMVQSGNYLYPTFNGDLRPDKPILIYWLMSLPVRLLGASELACRMVAPLATLGTALLTARTAALLGGPPMAIPAFLMLCLCPLMVVSGSAATTDALLLFCMTGFICSFLFAWRQGFRMHHGILMCLALAGALLTKGPVGLLPVLIILLCLALLGRGLLRPLPFTLWILGAVAIAAGVFLAWGIPANLATNGEFGARGIGHHVVKRAVTPLESHGGQSFLFYFTYLPVIGVAFFPWTLYLPFLFSRTSAPSDRQADDCTPVLPLLRKVVLGWALPVLGLMSLVATKLPHYILPAFPALAIGTAAGFQQARKAGLKQALGPASWIGLTLFCIVGLALGSGLLLAPWFLPAFGLRVPAAAMGLVFLAMTGIAVYRFRRGRHDATLATLAAGMTLVLWTATLSLLPAIEAYKVSPHVASCILRETAPEVPVSTCGFGEPSLTFYLDRGIVESLDEPRLPEWVARRTPGVLVITKPKLRQHRSLFRKDHIRKIAQIPGFNYSQGKWVTLVILERKACD